MRAVIQRVSKASVVVEGELVSGIEAGVLVLLGVEDPDSDSDAEWLAGKISNMRIFEDDQGRMNVSLLEAGGDALVVSQFTLHASTKKGNRPSFIRAARPEQSEPLYERFCTLLSERLGKPVRQGSFGAMMAVNLCNDGPVTIVIDSKARE